MVHLILEWMCTLISIEDLNKVCKNEWFKKDDHYKLPEYDVKFIIGDIMIDSHQWALVLNSEGKTETIIEMDYESKVADSISNLLVTILNESPYALVGSEAESRRLRTHNKLHGVRSL